eukprot:TRINITY_DN60953_c0_g1_i1.p1 TRINITY_DN60953_c0_g1~~TRINITY_DN60953_c0_g1_i1.p1  ORF type:complete len:249 (+),score=36.95 TRINITY_DN60953_c0_g1_i1:31-777(+)
MAVGVMSATDVTKSEICKNDASDVALMSPCQVCATATAAAIGAEAAPQACARDNLIESHQSFDEASEIELRWCADLVKHRRGSSSPFSLEVRPSSLGDSIGLGLFTSEAIPKDHVVCVYTGIELPTREAMRLEDKSFLMRIGQQSYVDARGCPEVLARYINDCRNEAVFNVRFAKRPQDGVALVVSIRHICAGEEIFVDYGRWYWASLKPHRIAPLQACRILLAAEAGAAKSSETPLSSMADDTEQAA